MKFKDNHIEVEAPKKTKKMTGTRFGAVLGVNAWSTPFKVWCEMTKVYEDPFVDSIYTIAGKTIEPKQIQYMKDMYAMDNLKTPTDIFGADYFNKTFGDFFKTDKIFGGMWDSVLMDGDTYEAVLEFKTTKRAEDWADGKIPEYYALQAALYAYLLEVEDVIMVCSFLKESDYEHPEKFTPSVDNTVTREFKVHERYPNFDALIEQATAFWNNFVMTGVSPDYDEKKDADILKVLKTNYVDDDADLEVLANEAKELYVKLNVAKEQFKADEDRLDSLKDAIKAKLMDNLTDGKTAARYGNWNLAQGKARASYDTEAMKKDGVYDKYVKTSKPTYTLTFKEDI